jgi:hypothetical protein
MEMSLNIGMGDVYILTPLHTNTGENHDINITNRSSENETMIKYLVTARTNRNCVNEEINNKLNSENACYNSVQNLFFFPSAV